jgi:hypothetical protein
VTTEIRLPGGENDVRQPVAFLREFVAIGCLGKGRPSNVFSPFSCTGLGA